MLAVEDVSGRSVALDVSGAETLHGMITVGCVVLLQGEYDADGLAPAAAARAAAAAAGVAGPAASTHRPGGSAAGMDSSRLGSALAFVPGGGSGRGAGLLSAGLSSLAPPPPPPLGVPRYNATLLEHSIPGVFHVAAAAHPPPEPREETLRAMGIVDPLRLLDTPADAARARAQESSREEKRVTWLVASHVHLDVPGTHTLLGELLAGFSAARSLPAALVLMGDFLAAPYGSRPGDRGRLTAGLAALAETLSAFPSFLEAAHVILVPGPHDPGAPGVAPHLPLLSHFCGPLLDRARFPRLSLTTSPARLSFFTREVVLWRDEPTAKLRRCSLLPLAPGIEPSEHVGCGSGGVAASSACNTYPCLPLQMARTLVEQAHLSPLPLAVQPTYWPLDHALRLSPTPDAVLAGESLPAYVHAHGGCCVANPGPFGETGAFLLYRPALGRAELSAVRPGDGGS